MHVIAVEVHARTVIRVMSGHAAGLAPFNLRAAFDHLANRNSIPQQLEHTHRARLRVAWGEPKNQGVFIFVTVNTFSGVSILVTLSHIVGGGYGAVLFLCIAFKNEAPRVSTNISRFVAAFEMVVIGVTLFHFSPTAAHAVGPAPGQSYGIVTRLGLVQHLLRKRGHYLVVGADRHDSSAPDSRTAVETQKVTRQPSSRSSGPVVKQATGDP